MIDFDNNLVMVFLTNSINTPIFEPVTIDNANRFSGKLYYTTGSLGFVPQILYTSVGTTESPEPALKALIQDMAADKERLASEEAAKRGGSLRDDHPLMKSLKAIQEVAQKYAGN